MSNDAKNSEDGKSVKVSLSDADGRLSELTWRVHAGEDVILTRYRRPFARLVPIVRKP
jgi:antitoxin (DNA-binding transcriptional repressor) of toxin-antitoxin stability system